MTKLTPALALAAALLVAACGSDTPEPPSTEGTTRALLGGPSVQAGPATEVRLDSSLVGRANLRDIPVLGHNFGSVDAPLKLMEFSDYGCGYCRRFHEETFPTLRAEFVDTEMIEWKFIPFITGNFPGSLAVTEAAECTLEQDPAKFEALSEVLWDRQQEWKASDEPEAVVRGWAAELDVDLPELDSCLAEDRRMPRIRAHTALAQTIGVRGTPTFWIVGFGPLQGALPTPLFREILSAVHQQKMAAEPPAPAR
ncbi:MAG TPA: thioredoxin domain-containing protein [Longimicrobiales bacterium]|nr:thioredoxin domain-containing protein [Longimicrobiales bacterium]